jgi:hypothetical protein
LGLLDTRFAQATPPDIARSGSAVIRARLAPD